MLRCSAGWIFVGNNFESEGLVGVNVEYGLVCVCDCVYLSKSESHGSWPWEDGYAIRAGDTHSNPHRLTMGNQYGYRASQLDPD